MALMKELTELDRIHLVLALQRHTSKQQLVQQASMGIQGVGPALGAQQLFAPFFARRRLQMGSDWRPSWLAAPVACICTANHAWRAATSLAAGTNRRAGGTCSCAFRRQMLLTDTCCVRQPAWSQETQYVDDLVKLVKRESHAQHSKLTRCSCCACCRRCACWRCCCGCGRCCCACWPCC